MPRSATKDLLKFLKPYEPDKIAAAMWLREFVWDLYPKTNELIYDNYNAVAFGWSPSYKAGDIFCSIAVYGKGVNFGFNWGSRISDPKGILVGEASRYRRIPVKEVADFPKTYVKSLLKEAYQYSLARLEDRKELPKLDGATIVKSISPVKKRPAKSKK